MDQELSFARSTAVDITNIYAGNRLHLRAQSSAGLTLKNQSIQIPPITEIDGTDEYMGSSIPQYDINETPEGLSVGLLLFCFHWLNLRKGYHFLIKKKDEQILKEMERANDAIPPSLGSKVSGTVEEIDAFWNYDAMKLDKHEWVRFREYLLSEIKKQDDEICEKREVQISRYVTTSYEGQDTSALERAGNKVKETIGNLREEYKNISMLYDAIVGFPRPEPIDVSGQVLRDSMQCTMRENWTQGESGDLLNGTS